MGETLESWKERLGRIPGVGVLMRAIEKSNEDRAEAQDKACAPPNGL